MEGLHLFFPHLVHLGSSSALFEVKSLKSYMIQWRIIP